jgi:hypothetical protein
MKRQFLSLPAQITNNRPRLRPFRPDRLHCDQVHLLADAFFGPATITHPTITTAPLADLLGAMQGVAAM